MDIPELNITVTTGAVNGQVYDIIDYDNYVKNKDIYIDAKYNIGIKHTMNDKEIVLPLKGKYDSNSNMNPGVYNAGCIDFFIEPEEPFVNKYIAKNSVTKSNHDDIEKLILSGIESQKLDEAFISSPDNITNIPIKESDQPEMICLKSAINAKHIDLDKYAGRFGENFPNDKRQLKNGSATLNIIKRYCENCDMEALLILRDKDENVPNPMNKEICVSLTNPTDIYLNIQQTDDDEDDSDY